MEPTCLTRTGPAQPTDHAQTPALQFGKVITTDRPQCMGLTAAELQCRNSARRTSKYCASHRGYRPSEQSATQKKGADTLPHVGKAEDTKPSFRHHAKTLGAAKAARKTMTTMVNGTKR